MRIISRILDWLKRNLVIWRSEDECQEFFRQRIEATCNIAGSNEKIALAFFTLVDSGTWSMKHMSDAMKLLPRDRYKEVSALLESMFAEVKSDV